VTPQDVSNFVNQPTPRKVPREISRKVTNWNSPVIWFFALMILWPVVMMLFTFRSEVSIMDYVRLLNSGSQNRITTQGYIISIRPTRLWEIGPTSYNLTTRFSASGGDRLTVSYVWRRSNIPGWGVIPETQNNPHITEVLSLAEPFPVTVEYFRTHPQVARAIGTRFTINISDTMLFVVIFALVFMAMLLQVYIDAHKPMRLLREGLFTTGYVSLDKKVVQNGLSFFTTLKQSFDGNDSSLVANFTDQRGMGRECFIKLPTDKENERLFHDLVRSLLPWRIGKPFRGKNEKLFENFIRNEQPVGLLYLPDMDAVIVTDLWLDSNPTIETSQKHEPGRNNSKT